MCWRNWDCRWNWGGQSDDPEIGRWAWVIQVDPYSHEAPVSGRGRQRRESKVMREARDLPLPSVEVVERPGAKECLQGLEAVKGEGRASSPEPPEGTRPCQHTDFRPATPTRGSCPKWYDNKCVFLSHHVCSHLLQQTQETHPLYTR